MELKQKYHALVLISSWKFLLQIFIALMLLTSLIACNTYAISEYTSLGNKNYSCECVTTDGTIIEIKEYINKSRKKAERYCSETEQKYHQNKQSVTCSLK